METSYDQIAYSGYAYPRTHPDRLATVAYLHGMAPAPIEHCRVLELGCGEGANLIPMALQLPESEFCGIDRAASPIEKGCRQIQQLGLANIRLEHGDLMEFLPADASFDYIIAHGLYSWVSPAAQEKILQIVQNSLAPQGVAYISYNALPGWHLSMMLREMMQYYVRDLDSPVQEMERARSLVEFLAGAQIESDAWGTLLRQEWERMSRRAPWAVFHDELAEFNTPLYFHEFIARAERHRLQFLSEAGYGILSPMEGHFVDTQLRNLHPRVRESLNELGEDFVAREQYLDFLKGRRFRQTLLCHKSIPVDRNTRLDSVMNLLVASNAQPSTPLSTTGLESPVQFCGPNESSITTAHPLIKATLICLCEKWPLPLPFAAVWEMAHAKLSDLGSAVPYDTPEDRTALARTLLLCYGAGVLDLHSWAPRLALEPGDQPACSPLARLQAREGNEVTTLCHQTVRLRGSLEKKLIQLLDGTRDRFTILQDLEQMILSGEATENGEPAKDVSTIRIKLHSELDGQLNRLARLGLLMADKRPTSDVQRQKQ